MLRCDPGICDDCQYIGEGDFICSRDIPLLVVEDWEPNENYLQCKLKNRCEHVKSKQ